jgi:nitrogen fixation NifU-like protein
MTSMDQMYREQLLDHYKNPRNTGELGGATHRAKLENLSCGDEVELFIKVVDDTIEDISFVGTGCAVAIAAASLLTDELKDQSLEDAKKITFEDLEELLGIELSPSRKKCAHLCLLAFQDATK